MARQLKSISKNQSIGAYIIQENLPQGRGGFAQVYRAKVRESGETHILKVSRVASDDVRYGDALRFEADLLKKLAHPGIVKIIPMRLPGARVDDHAAKAHEIKGTPWYYAMEYLEGDPLEDYIANKSFLPADLMAAIVLRVSTALEYLHQLGYTHRDVKPDNIIFRQPLKKGAPIEPVLIDFGIATKRHSETKGMTMQTAPPEHVRQARGMLAPEVQLDGALMDVYSLGAVFYRSITGQYPYTGRTQSSLTSAILHKSVPPPTEHNPSIPPEIEAIVMNCLEKDPRVRTDMPRLVRQLDLLVGDIEFVQSNIKRPRKKKR